MKNFNNRYLCKNIHRYFTDISDISVKSITDISVFTDILILASREWQMLETVGQFRLQYSDQAQGVLESLVATPSLLSKVIES